MDLRAGVNPASLWALTGFTPHSKGQADFVTSPARFAVACAGRRWGKSFAAAARHEPELFRLHSDGSPTVGWIVPPQFKLAKEFDYFYEDIVLRACRGMRGIKSANNPRTGEMYIKMPWGSKVEVRSADHPQSLVSEGLDWVIVSEAAKQPRNVWQKYLRPALADHHGTATFPSTPEGFNWFKEIYDVGQDRTKNPEWDSWRFPSWDNPVVYPKGFDDSEIQELLSSVSEDWFWQEIGADFRSVVGLTYGNFDREKNVLTQPWTFKPEWRNYLAVDFGWQNPFVAIDVQVGPNDEIVPWREHYARRMTLNEHAHAITSRSQPSGYHLDCIFADSANPEGVEILGRLVAPTQAANEAKQRDQGIELVRSMLPAIKIDPGCTNTIFEFENNRTAPQIREGENYKEDPRKADDHCLAAGTLVTTTRGDVRIERVTTDDEVLTRNGWRRVLRSWCAGRDRHVMFVKFSNGRGFRATPEHLIWSETVSDWVRLDSLRYGDKVQTCPPPILPTSTEPLERSGVKRSARSHRSTRSITSTGTRATMRSKILRACRGALTRMFTSMRREPDVQPQNGWHTWNESECLQPSGTAHPKVALGTASMGSAPGRIGSRSRGSVMRAATGSRVSLGVTTTDSARTTASPIGEGALGLMTRTELAPPVGRRSVATSTRRSAVAHVVVPPISVGVADVYDLTVEDEHEFYANGVLVHNCLDALRYLLMHLYRLGARGHLEDLAVPTEVDAAADQDTRYPQGRNLDHESPDSAPDRGEEAGHFTRGLETVRMDSVF